VFHKMTITSRLDFRQFLVIVILLVALYWLLLPGGKKSTHSTDSHHKHSHEGYSHEENSQQSREELLPTDQVETIEKDGESELMKEKDNTINKLQEEIEKLKFKEIPEDNQHANDEIQKELDELKEKHIENEEKNSNVVNSLKKELDTLNKTYVEAAANAKKMKDLDKEIQIVSTKNDMLLKENEALKVHQTINVTPFKGLKLMHLDLKGAPPKIDYLITIIKYCKKFGVDGLLIEYEDMFPWFDEFKILQSENAYTLEDIQLILSTAADENMIVIPLIQTFGHLEFLLKHKEFAHLRADAQITTSICPINNDSVPLLKRLLDQVIKYHPDSKWIHLGGDEIWNLATCTECVRSGMTNSNLFLHHLKPLFQYISESKTKDDTSRKSIIWDDMLREWDVEELKQISSYTSPMVWAYVADLDGYKKFPANMWERYTQAFSEIWIASSFKGALKPWSNVVPIKQHMQNHLSWLKITSMLEQKKIDVKGIALTGWSRFDHFGPLCEVLPVGIPSLALCLGILKTGGFSTELHSNISTTLGFKKPFRIDMTNLKMYEPENGKYPGSDLYHLAGLFEKALGWRDWTFVREHGWMREYNIERKHLSFFQFNQTLNAYTKSKSLMEKAKPLMEKVLSQYFDSDTVNEWIADKFDANMKNIDETLTKIQMIMKKVRFP